MPRPESVTNEDIFRWSERIDKDLAGSPALGQNPIIREVCYAGQWLADKLIELNCPDHLIGRMIYTAGGLSFGRGDPWTVHQEILSLYMDGSLEFAMEPEDLS